MLEEQLKAFIAKAKDDQSIQEKLKAASDADAVAAIAKEAGFSISADDLKNAQSEFSELAEQELEWVAGAGCVTFGTEDPSSANNGVTCLCTYAGCGWTAGTSRGGGGCNTTV